MLPRWREAKKNHLEVAGDHEQRALKHGLHYPRHVLLHRVAELLDSCGEERQNLGIPRAGDIPLQVKGERQNKSSHGTGPIKVSVTRLDVQGKDSKARSSLAMALSTQRPRPPQ